jgi:alanyl-tRNA synthetase
MNSSELRAKYIKYFEKSGHVQIPPASLVPEDDPTTLFTSSGMQPLVPYLLGQPHPQGKRLVNSQPSFRGQGINDDTQEVGDMRHTTFFEMLGNWSLGDYFKKEQLEYFFTFLTDNNEGLGLDPSKLYVTVFAGNDQVPKDTESIEIWQKLFKQKNIEVKEGERIFAYGVDKNWWSRSGTPEQMPIGEIGGPDSEVYYDFGLPHDPRFGKKCHPACDCGRFLEIGNSVFMQYQKQAGNKFVELPQKNVDFGGGLERLLSVVQNDPDFFKTDLFLPIISAIEKLTGKKYADDENKILMRVIADHIKASVFLIKAGVQPSNKDRGYVLRRLLRRAAVKTRSLNSRVNLQEVFSETATEVVKIYQGLYFNQETDLSSIKNTITEEVSKFSRTLEKGLKQIQKIELIDGKAAFDLYQTYGFPIEITTELATQKGQKIDTAEFKQEYEKHKETSRTASAGMFKGGLADHSEINTKYHTATHLLQAALRKILGTHVQQTGSNISPERLRFDFSHPEKLTPDQLAEVEQLVNRQIKADLKVTSTVMGKEAALKSGALGFFTEKYGDQVSVYAIGDFSKEICGGPHVEHIGILGNFKIIKEESAGAGIRRIYATLSEK